MVRIESNCLLIYLVNIDWNLVNLFLQPKMSACRLILLLCLGIKVHRRCYTEVLKFYLPMFIYLFGDLKRLFDSLLLYPTIGRGGLEERQDAKSPISLYFL